MLKWGFTEEEAAAAPELFKGTGCPRCGGIGYKGRQALLETLPLNEELRTIIIEGTSADAIKRKGLEQGMMSLRRVGILNAIRGITTMEEVLSITMSDR
jgi:type II secretory ATPase GspE/PulE/Tfp pilus assembly ATPase PilB-like protein